MQVKTLATASPKQVYLKLRQRVLYGGFEYEIRSIILHSTSTRRYVIRLVYSSSSSSSSPPLLGATALRQPWPPMLFASTGLYPELSFSILQFPSLVGPLERHLAI